MLDTKGSAYLHHRLLAVVSSLLASFVQVGRTIAHLKGPVSVIGGCRPVPRLTRSLHTSLLFFLTILFNVPQNIQKTHPLRSYARTYFSFPGNKAGLWSSLLMNACHFVLQSILRTSSRSGYGNEPIFC